MRLIPSARHHRVFVVSGVVLAVLAAGVTTVAARGGGTRPSVAPPSLPTLAAAPRDGRVHIVRPTPKPAAKPKPRVRTTPRRAAAPAAPKARPKPKPKPIDRLAALRGLSAWVDLYDYGTSNAEAADLADVAARHGVRTIWVETSRYNTANIAYPGPLGALVDQAARHGLHVIAWVLPEFRSVSADAAHARAAASFRSPRGHRFSALGLDIEVSSGAAPADRSARLVSLSRSLHGRVGMPLVAIVPPPIGFSRHPSYWPGFPWQTLAANADALATMGYWSYSHDAEPGSYTSTVLRQTRELVGRSYPIHVIGGLAADTSMSGAASFCRAALTGHALGASLYDLRSTPSSLWTPLQACRGVGL